MAILVRTSNIMRAQDTAKIRGNWATFNPEFLMKPMNITDYKRLSPFYDSDHYFTMIEGVYSFQQNDMFACGYYCCCRFYLLYAKNLQLGEIPEAIKGLICNDFKTAFFSAVKGDGINAQGIIDVYKNLFGFLECVFLFIRIRMLWMLF